MPYTEKTISFKEWVFKCSLLLTCGLALDIVGNKIRFIEIDLYTYRITAYGLDYYFYLACSGLLLGLGFWRLLEIYWWGTEQVKLLRACED